MSLEERLFKSFDDQQKVEHEAREIETLINSFEGSAGLLPTRQYGTPVDPSKFGLTLKSIIERNHKELEMAKSYWLVNSNRSRVKRFIENTNNKDQFFKYMFIDSGKVTSTWGKEPPVMTTREELKIEAAREAWKKLIAQGWRRTEEVWVKE